MTAVTVTVSIGTTAHYVLIPKAVEDATGLGVTVPDIIYGWTDKGLDGAPSVLTLALDDQYVYDVDMSFRNAPPIVFKGFRPSDGDLLTELTAQGWVSL